MYSLSNLNGNEKSITNVNLSASDLTSGNVPPARLGTNAATASNSWALFLGGSNLYWGPIGASSLGFQPATNSFSGIITPLGYTPLTNSSGAITNALGYKPETNGAANTVSNFLQTAIDGKQSSLGFQPATNTYAGITNALGFQPATNSAGYSTNAHASATNSLDMSRNYADFSATTAMAITNFSNVDATRENSSVLMVTNGSGGDLVLYLTPGVTTMDGARSFALTNNTLTVFSFSIYGNRFTNCAYRTFY